MPSEYWLRFLVAALACFRLAEMVALDDGPFDLFLRLRIVAGVYDRDASGRSQTNVGRLFACPYCLGVWFAAGLAVWLDLSLTFPVTWFALAGTQALFQSIGGRQ